MRIISLFSGIGGLDFGFIKAGFNISWSNDSDIYAKETYCRNISSDYFDTRKIEHIPFNQIPDKVDGIIAGLPGNGWSVFGSLKGISKREGQYIFDFIKLLKQKKPAFFLIEILTGFIYKNNRQPYLFILELLHDQGYSISQEVLNASDYNIPQDRKRVYIIGLKNSIGKSFIYPSKIKPLKTIRDSIYDLKDNAIKTKKTFDSNYEDCIIPNHEYLEGGYSPHFMSRNRVRGWDEVSYTIQGDRRLIPLHPNAPRMIPNGKNKYSFNTEYNHLYRRLSIRECARLQSFDDDFIFEYNSLNIGYRLVGNATPPKLSYLLAVLIKEYL